MRPIFYIKRVKESDSFKQFMKEDPKAYLCSLFCTEDFVEKRKEIQVDFYSPKQKMIINFKVDKGVERVPIGKKAETMTHKKFVPKPLDEDIKMDFDELEPALADEMHNRGMTYQIEKVLTFVNVTDGEIIWNCTAFLRGLGLLIVHIEDKSRSILYMEKKSFFDLIRFEKGGAGLQTKVVDGNKMPDDKKDEKKKKQPASQVKIIQANENTDIKKSVKK